MNRDDLLTRADLEALWNMGKDGVNARLRKYGQDVRKVKIGNITTSAVTRSEADRIDRACRESVDAARRKSGETRTSRIQRWAHHEPRPARVEPTDLKLVTPAKQKRTATPAKKQRKGGWKDGNSALFLPKIPAPVEPALPPCEPTIRGLIQRYHVSEKTIRGWIVDNLLRFDADGYVDGPSMARVARCYQPRRASRWMERTLAEYGEV
jgi:hypothetical protein